MSVQENPSHAGLPPPPTIHHEFSDVHNASTDNETRGHAFCDKNPLWPPRNYDEQTQFDIANGRSHLVSESLLHRFSGRRSLIQQFNGKGRSEYKCLMSEMPLYSAVHSRPYTSGQKFTAYYEIRVLHLNPQNGGIAIGFIAPPYPDFRLPGWERASMAVHGDDGHRFVNDTYGGRDFTTAFKKGETIGIGIEFVARGKYISSSFCLPTTMGFCTSTSGTANALKQITINSVMRRRCDQYSKHARFLGPRFASLPLTNTAIDNQKSLSPALPHVKCFMVRGNRRKPEYEWDLHEEVDSTMEQPGGVEGLEGDRDLHAAVGFYGDAEVEVRFGRENCSWWPM